MGLSDYRNELATLLQKSQDAFEKQLSYISAGALTLSIGFIKDIVKDLKNVQSKSLLTTGWLFLGLTLLVNLVSHIRAAKVHYQTIKEIDTNAYDQVKALRRIKEIDSMNIISAATLIIGISLVIIFVSINIYHG